MKTDQIQRRIYVLTGADIQRIKNLVEAVEDAVGDLVNYRCVPPIDPRTELASEEAVYLKAVRIIEKLNCNNEPIF
jgi:hypothetical protein